MNNLPSYAWLIIGRAGIATQTFAFRVWLGSELLHRVSTGPSCSKGIWGEGE